MKTKVIWEKGVDTTRQSSEFYCYGEGETHIARVTNGENTLYVVANGEMYLSIPEIVDGELVERGATVIRYTDRLEEAGIQTDRDLHVLLKQVCVNLGYQIYHNNNWFEVYNDDIPDGVVCDTLDDAIETAKELLKSVL
jgi:hypothetical protein